MLSSICSKVLMPLKTVMMPSRLAAKRMAQLAHGLGYHFRLDLRVDTVLVIQVDIVCVKTLQTAFYRSADLGRRAVQDRSVLSHCLILVYSRIKKASIRILREIDKNIL